MKISLENLGAREQRALAIAGLCIVVLLLRTFVVYPLWNKFKELDDEIISAKLQLTLLREEVRYGRALEKAYLRVCEILQASGTPSEEKDRLGKQINEIVKRHRIDCQSVEAKSLVRSRAIGYQEYAIELAKAKGDIAGLIRFLYDIDTAPGLLCVERLNVAREKDDSTGIRVEFGALLTKMVLSNTPVVSSPEK